VLGALKTADLASFNSQVEITGQIPKIRNAVEREEIRVVAPWRPVAADIKPGAGRQHNVIAVEVEVEILKPLVVDIRSVKENFFQLPCPQVARTEYCCRVADEVPCKR